MDTGMSGRGVAILQQGHIDAILNAKPEERRAIFDEAAGITKYKIKKEAATRKLASPTSMASPADTASALIRRGSSHTVPGAGGPAAGASSANGAGATRTEPRNG